MSVSPDTATDLARKLSTFHRTLKCAATQKHMYEGTGTALQSVLTAIGDNGRIRAKDIAERLGVGDSVLSRHVSVLMEQGLITREHDPEDRRAQWITLTHNGVEELGRIRDRRIGLLQEVLNDWPEEQARTAADILDRLTDSIQTSLRAMAAGPSYSTGVN